MGKILIIKDANFSKNKIITEVIYTRTMLNNLSSYKTCYYVDKNGEQTKNLFAYAIVPLLNFKNVTFEGDFPTIVATFLTSDDIPTTDTMISVYKIPKDTANFKATINIPTGSRYMAVNLFITNMSSTNQIITLN